MASAAAEPMHLLGTGLLRNKRLRAGGNVILGGRYVVAVNKSGARQRRDHYHRPAPPSRERTISRQAIRHGLTGFRRWTRLVGEWRGDGGRLGRVPLPARSNRPGPRGRLHAVVLVPGRGTGQTQRLAPGRVASASWRFQIAARRSPARGSLAGSSDPPARRSSLSAASGR